MRSFYIFIFIFAIVYEAVCFYGIYKEYHHNQVISQALDKAELRFDSYTYPMCIDGKCTDGIICRPIDKNEEFQ